MNKLDACLCAINIGLAVLNYTVGNYKTMCIAIAAAVFIAVASIYTAKSTPRKS